MLIDATEGRRLLDAEKDAGGSAAHWHLVRSPVSGVILRKHLDLPVAVRPSPPVGDLVIVGEWKGPAQIQIFLYLMHGVTQLKLCRLCLTPRHGSDLHWHYLEDITECPPGPVSHPPGKINEVTMLNDVFVPTMKVTNLANVLL